MNAIILNKITYFMILKNNSDFYFTHSMLYEADEKIILTYTNYDKKFISSVNYNNIYGPVPSRKPIKWFKIVKNFMKGVNC